MVYKFYMKLISIIFMMMFMGSVHANAKTLKAAFPDWTGGEITCQVAVSILEDELGYKVKRISMSSGTGLWEAVARGNIDFACESWPSYAEADDVMLSGELIYEGQVVREYRGDGSVEILGTTGIIGSSDYFVPRYFIDANPDFKGWEDLNKHKEQFATAETGGKGRLIGCPVSGWNCHDQKRLDLLGINFEADFLGTEVAALAEAAAAYNRREPFLLYLWEPHWFHGKYDLVPINLPEHKICPTFTASNNWRDCGKNAWPATGWMKDYTINYGNPKTFNDPYFSQAKEFFKNMNLSNVDQSKMLVRVLDDGISVKQAVKEWKKNNKYIWTAWLNETHTNTMIASESQSTSDTPPDFELTPPVVKIPEMKIDKSPPIFEIDDYIRINQRKYSLKGNVYDDNQVFVEANGVSWPVIKNTFTIEGSVPIGINEIEVVAFDTVGNEVSKKIIVERVIETADVTSNLEQLNPEKIRSKPKKERIALIIGIEEYKNISSANYAKRDAEFFIDYVQSAFGVPQNNINYFFNSDAVEQSKFQIKTWLKKNVRKNSEVYLYFSGHGMALNDGQELYLLTHDTITEFINETALNRNEIFNDIAQYNPKSVTAFLDTCYSGAGRADGEMLLAMAKGLVVVDEQQQKLPDNFTLFTAASAQESAWSLPEAKHGTFSYFLMKGMEGNADLNGDKKLTNGELRDYLLDNVGRYAQQQQTPQMVGDPNQVLIKF